ncbi:ROK family protein [Nocardia vermiculata]|uniref:ROK family protein n=1 Tax=Nocardia vermiculata TaxID=257274 RepID=A0A846Y8J7_9NOCA|nr:ROK family protein [Nocardia vermiculata]NKY54051.1 ROK family protein [Nocardia vermiculata]
MGVLALDIGASKFAAAVVGADAVRADGIGMQLRHITRIDVPAGEVWAACRSLLTRVVELAGSDDACGGAGFEVTAVGIAAAGPVDRDSGSTAPLNIPEWSAGFPVVDAVGELFPGAEIHFAIDGAALAAAELRVGGLRGVRQGLAMTVSSGIGGGIVSEGRVLLGRTGNAGHVGHIVVPGWDVPCACGGTGCVEAVASGMSSVRWAREQGWAGATGAELARAANSGDRTALAALARAGTALGQAVSAAAATLDIDRVVIGGGFAESGAPLWDPLLAAVHRHARLGFLRDLQVEKSSITEGATLVGAAALAR